MARELVTENGVGESAAAVWRQIQSENGNVLNSATIPSDPAPVVEDAPLTMSLVTPDPTVVALVQAPKFGSRQTPTRPNRRRDESPADIQFSLF